MTNPNLSRAARVIHEGMARFTTGRTGDAATRIAAAMDAAGLITTAEGPGRPAWALPAGPPPLVRRSTGRPAEPPAVEAPAPSVKARADVTELEIAATEWDEQCDRALQVTGLLLSRYASHPDVIEIVTDYDRAVVAVRVKSLEDWDHWMAETGVARLDSGQSAGTTRITYGRLRDVEVRLVAHGVPELLDALTAAAIDPYRLYGRVYDLGRPMVDRDGNRWKYLGQRGPDEMPLLVAAGQDVPCSLANVVHQAGPLRPAVPYLPAPVPAAATPPGATSPAGAVTVTSLTKALAASVPTTPADGTEAVSADA
ncbi:BN159_2729 family protein [Streptomyces sp. H39-S7]|uniref:BN159_2729 family protein n=1 Tax=Streptomyces sp. H39-S7 TaxID=3004357 RepID=UPI0022AEF3A6|nr:BN159_2729 family protein [Streptomyces sp. H39-S7]MCZ4123368.1 BN159_2729 family protein [Streptomyces sp. H39-S7]